VALLFDNYNVGVHSRVPPREEGDTVERCDDILNSKSVASDCIMVDGIVCEIETCRKVLVVWQNHSKPVDAFYTSRRKHTLSVDAYHEKWRLGPCMGGTGLSPNLHVLFSACLIFQVVSSLQLSGSFREVRP
jgi:hypothetical protein